MTFSREVFPVSLFPMQESGADEKMTVTSGRKCSGLLKNQGPLGLLVKTLLVSPLWSKEGYSLTWEAKQLFSERKTQFTDTCSEKPLPLNESAKILSTSDIPSNRFLFRLRLSELPTGETESLSLLMQAPTAVMTCESPEKMRARAERNGYKNGTKYGSLESQVQYDPKFKGLLKTPSAFDAASERMKSWDTSRDRGTLGQQAAMGKLNGLLPTPTAIEGVKWTNTYNPNSQMGQSLSAMAGSGMLPTPTARDYKNPSSPDGERIARKKEQGWTIELSDLANMGMLPTPVTRDYQPPVNSEHMTRKNGMTRDDALSNLPTLLGLKERGGITFRLSPLFTQEMMGFPLGWTEYPFLSANGEPNPSKPMEMQ